MLINLHNHLKEQESKETKEEAKSMNDFLDKVQQMFNGLLGKLPYLEEDDEENNNVSLPFG